MKKEKNNTKGLSDSELVNKYEKGKKNLKKEIKKMFISPSEIKDSKKK